MSAAPQSITALARANQVRTAHAELLEQLRLRPRRGEVRLPVPQRRREGASRAAAFLETGTGLSMTVRLEPFLDAIPGMGSTHANRMIAAIGVRSANKKLSELTDRQRSELAERLRTWGAGLHGSGSTFSGSLV